MSIWLSSDCHFNHERDFIWQARGFKSLWEMNTEIVKRWNSVVSEEDEVYLLGDSLMGDVDVALSYFRQLNGMIHLIRGNHDTDNKWEKLIQCHNVVEDCGYATMLKYGKWHFYLSHYPTKTANYDSGKKHLGQNVWNLCGHCHTKNKFREMFDGDLSYHVELDAHNCYPVLLDDIMSDIKRYYGRE